MMERPVPVKSKRPSRPKKSETPVTEQPTIFTAATGST